MLLTLVEYNGQESKLCVFNFRVTNKYNKMYTEFTPVSTFTGNNKEILANFKWNSFSLFHHVDSQYVYVTVLYKNDKFSG